MLSFRALRGSKLLQLFASLHIFCQAGPAGPDQDLVADPRVPRAAAVQNTSFLKYIHFHFLRYKCPNLSKFSFSLILCVSNAKHQPNEFAGCGRDKGWGIFSFSLNLCIIFESAIYYLWSVICSMCKCVIFLQLVKPDAARSCKMHEMCITIFRLLFTFTCSPFFSHCNWSNQML